MSIINNIALPLRLRNFSKKTIEKRIEELVLWLDLKNIIYRDIYVVRRKKPTIPKPIQVYT